MAKGPTNNFAFSYRGTGAPSLREKLSAAAGFPGFDPNVAVEGPKFAQDRAIQLTTPLPTNLLSPVQLVDYDIIDIDFTTATAETIVNRRVNFFWFLYGTSAGGTVPIILLRIGGKPKKQLKITPGVSVRDFPCDSFSFQTAITGTETGQLVIAWQYPNSIEVT